MLDPVEVAARTAWGEARGEGIIGMQAVLNTIANRASSPGWWGRDISSVCLENDQFSCWNIDDPNREKLINVDTSDKVFAVALSLAAKLVSGDLSDVTGGADSYYARGSQKPLWAKDKFFRCSVGRHEFYRMGVRGDGA